MVEVVVCRFGEDLSWTRNLPRGVHITIYDKTPLEEGRWPGAISLPNHSRDDFAWLHHLVQACLIVECRPAVRAFLQGLGLPAAWPDATHRQAAAMKPAAIPADGSSLLLAVAGGVAEAQLSAAAARLNPDRYEAVLRLDAQFQSLGAPEQALHWLNAQGQRHHRLLWLGPPLPGGDPKAHAVLAWARQRGRRAVVLWVLAVLVINALVAGGAWTLGLNINGLIGR